MEKSKIINYIIIIASIVFIAVVGSVLVNIGMEWFSLLDKPNQFIPSFVIPIVWSVIYVTFAIVLCVWSNKENFKKSTILLLILNGIFNILWCLFFFTLNQTFIGLISIVILLILSYLLVVNIFKQKQVYAYFTAIYPLWVSIATTLNLALWILN